MKSLIYKRPFGWELWMLKHLTQSRPTISIKVFDMWQHLIPAALRKNVLHGGHAIIESEMEKSISRS